MLLASVLNDWYQGHGCTLKDAPNLVSNIRTIVRYCGAADYPPTREHLGKMLSLLEEQNYAPGTIRHLFSVLRRALNYIADRRGDDLSALRYPRLPVVKGKMRDLNTQEVTFLYNALPNGVKAPTARNLAILLVETGMRLDEALTLRWKDVVDKDIVLWRPKTEVETIIPISSLLAGMFDCMCDPKYRSREGLVLEIPSATHAQVRALREAITKVNNTFTVRTRRYGKATIHSLRDTFATNMLQEGLPLVDVAYLLGHTNIRQTMKYAHVTQGDAVEKAREIMG